MSDQTDPQAETGGGESWLNELLFALAVLAFGAIYFWQSMLITVEEGGVNARTLPAIMSGAILLYGLGRAIQLLLRRPESAAPRIAQGRSILLWVVLPLTVEMVVYVQLIHLAGYLLATFLTMLAVFWTFGLRRPLPMILLSAGAAVVMQLIFVKLLGLYMPSGSLIDLALF